jgi:hypothetical protein
MKSSAPKGKKMVITNKESGTNIHEIADGIYRINTPVSIEGGPDTCYLIVSTRRVES